MSHLTDQAIGELRICGSVGAYDLHVKRRRHSEVQDLSNDIGRWKRGRYPGKIPMYALSDLGHELSGWIVLWVKRHQDIGIRRTRDPGIGISKIDTAVREADVIDDRL